MAADGGEPSARAPIAARTRRSVPPHAVEDTTKRNGAGIAADPTLTDAWSLLRRAENLASDVFPSIRRNGLQVLSPALAPASGSTLQPLPGPVRQVRRPSLSLPEPAFNGRFRDRAFHWPAPRTVALLRSEDLCSASSAHGRADPTHVGTTSRVRHRPGLRAAPKCFAKEVSRPARTGSAMSLRIEILLVLQAVRPSKPEGFRSVPMT